MRQALLYLLCAALAVAPLTAQRDFNALRGELDAARDAMVKSKNGRPAFEDVVALAKTATARLETFLEDAQGDDATNARLMLANVWMDVGRTEDAKQALMGFTPETTPPLALVAAAELAARVGADDLRERFVAAAVKKDAPLEQRMALAIFLATRLVEIARADHIFATALEAAKDDEQRAHIAWYRCASLRAREDVEEDAWITALDELAESYASTYWGGVARDRKRALELRVGSPAIAFAGRTLDGRTLALPDLAGKVVLLEFWGDQNERAGPFLRKLKDEFGAKGFAIVGIAALDDAERARTLARESERDWPQMFDGRGLQTDLALRYGIERLPDFVLLDRAGKVALLNVFLDDADGRLELRNTIADRLGGD